MIAVNPYLTFDGKAEAAFNFYKSVFGGEFAMVQRFKDMPPPGGADNGCGDMQISAEEGERIMHIALPLTKNHVLMASDTVPSMGHPFAAGNNFSLSLSAASKEEATDLFNKLSVDGHVSMPLQDTFWGAFMGMCTDAFGIQWMISYDARYV